MARGRRDEKGDRKRFCVVARSVDEASWRKDRDCERHTHVSWSELNVLHAENSLQPIGELGQANPDDDRPVEPDYIFEWLIPGHVIRYKRHIPTRGLSSKYGEVIANALGRREAWARLWVSQVRGELETGSGI